MKNIFSKLYNDDLLNDNNLIGKFILWYRKQFGNDLFYTVELNKRYKLSNFLKKHWGLLILFVALGVLIIICYCLSNKNKADSVNAFDLISLMVTYISSIALSVVVYYHTWAQDKLDDKRKGLSVLIEPINFYSSKLSSFYKNEEVKQIIDVQTQKWQGLQPDKAEYIGLVFNNLNHASPIRIKFKDIYFLDSDNDVQKLNCVITSDNDESKGFVDFDKRKIYFIGIDRDFVNNEVFDKKRMLRCYALFEISNVDDHRAFSLVEIHLKNRGLYEGHYTYLLDVQKFIKLKKKHGVKFFQDISVSRKIGNRFCRIIDYYF